MVAEITRAGEEFERTPPHDIAAEQCVLGGMLLSKDAISDVLEVIKPHDYYRPAHQVIHEVVLDLYARGEPADAITVSAELTKRGEIGRVGGALYLHTLIASVPTAANAGYYARIVRERAILRRLVEVGTRIVQLGYVGDGGADELVERAEAELYAVTDRRVSEDFLKLSDVMPGTLDEIEAIGSHSGLLTGVPTGFSDLDALTNGLHPGQMIVVAARPAIGKALALDTALPTPTGWTTMGEVSVGDWLLGADGRPAEVIAATGVMHGHECYRVCFDDGTAIVADAGHLWQTVEAGPTASPARTPSVVTTGDIARRMTEDSPAPTYLVDAGQPLDLPDADLPVPPYVLGRDEHDRIPGSYLRGSAGQRRALLAGLIDRVGVAGRAGSVELRVACADLAESCRELIVSLGYRCEFNGDRTGVSSPSREQAYIVSFTPAQQRRITAVRPVPSVPVRCVQVGSPGHLYLAGRSMIPTHNSTLALDLARSASIRHQLASVIFSLEMSRNEITMRLLSAESRISLQAMRTGHLGEEDWSRLARRMSEVVDAPLFIDDSPNMSMMEIRSKCRRLKQRHDLRLVIVDYLQLMTSLRRVENRQQEVSELSRSLKLLAKELDVPVVALSQLNRGPEQRTDKKPLLADLRESGSIEQDSDVVILLHREDAYEPESPRAGEADFIVAKHRNGPTATVTVAFQGHYSRFVDMAPI